MVSPPEDGESSDDFGDSPDAETIQKNDFDEFLANVGV